MPRGRKPSSTTSKADSNLGLTDLFRKTIQSEKIGTEKEFVPSYPSGIDIFDYRNGRMEFGKTVLGVDGGKIITIIGKSGVGKSSFAIKMACNIVEPFENSQILHYDYERATNFSRIMSISKWDKETINKKYILLNSGIYSESLYQGIKAIAKIKIENFDMYKLDSGKVDREGNNIFVLPPTVVIADSWATMTPENISEEEKLSGQMSATAIAKTNNAIIKRLVGTLEESNIILIIVNHITQNVSIGPVRTQASLNFLSQDESLPGGSSANFLANTLLKLKASSKLDPDKDFGIKGFIVIGELVKSRSNEAGYKFEMVFNQSIGYDNLLTNFLLLKRLNYLKGNGRAYYFDFDPDVKFTQKTFKETYNKNSSFRKAFNKAVQLELSNFLSGKIDNEDIGLNENKEEENNFKLIKKIKEDIWKANDGKYYHLNDDTGECIMLTVKEKKKYHIGHKKK